jgi:NADH-quinone oxidoreductase subunit B
LVFTRLSDVIIDTEAYRFTESIVLIQDEGSNFGVLDASLACCALETRSFLLGRPVWTGEQMAALVLLASGTISQKLAPRLVSLVQEFAAFKPELPHYLVAVGACATSGGPYFDSPSILAGLDKLGLTCDLYIPGCPPRPAEIAAGLTRLLNERARP